MNEHRAEKHSVEHAMQDLLSSPAESWKPRESGEGSTGQSNPAVASARDRSVAEKRLKRKLDLRLIPTIVLIYMLDYIDRNAISTARLKGLEHDLSLTDIQYDTVVAIFFTLYCAAQVPSTMLLNRVQRPSQYIGLCVIAWGLTTAMTGITQNYGGILICRLLTGLSESVFIPGSSYFLSRWYTRKELTLRTSIGLAGIMCSNAFGSLMAAGILSNMEGKRGIRGWRWLYFIEGAITIIIGLFSLWSLPDLPNNTRWLSPAERQLAQARLSEDAGEADEDLAQDSMWMGLKMAVRDIKVSIFAIMLLSTYLGLSFTNFFPSLTATLGFDTTITLLLAAPPWVFGATVTCINGYHADKTGERFFHQSNSQWGTIIGFIIGLSTLVTGGRYVALFLLAAGHASLPMIFVCVSNTIPRPPAKRAAAIGIVTGIGNVGNLIGSYTWKAAWAPLYHQSMIIGTAAMVLSSFLAFVMRCMLKRMNKRLDEDELGALKDANRERVEDAALLEGITLEEAMERKKGFRYLY
ncbi:MFS transporter [Fomitiporia mediterranea MF3/22]|uniref:MFS transporter n=1 Tax=Fomitiporia mediterranea (strain MF3/22) TaxID=694068 RepID=UPI00044072E2|nr:MFS transporter [Fomitiporia mediterranea MF3/22]EJD08020.1 MFS transporter [Fomitiporia mediterranea MF3/22]